MSLMIYSGRYGLEEVRLSKGERAQLARLLRGKTTNERHCLLNGMGLSADGNEIAEIAATMGPGWNTGCSGGGKG